MAASRHDEGPLAILGLLLMPIVAVPLYAVFMGSVIVLPFVAIIRGIREWRSDRRETSQMLLTREDRSRAIVKARLAAQKKSCDECGTTVSARVAAGQRCRSCDFDLKDGAAFCGQCGTAVASPPSVA